MSSDPRPPDEGPLISEFATDPEMADLVELFLGDLPDRISTLTTAWSAHEFETVQRVAHQLKGASAGYGYPSIGDAAYELENGIRALGDESTESESRLVQDHFEFLISLCERALAA